MAVYLSFLLFSVGLRRYLPSTRQIVLFSEGSHQPAPTDRIVYIDGDFDLFHVGHIEALRVAKGLGDYLIVGVHEDAVVNAVSHFIPS